MINLNVSGIYQIKNKINGKVYIGSSKNIRKRKNNHKCCLKNKNHWNIHLQKDVNKFGLKNFIFKILEVHDEFQIDYLIEREQYYLDLYKSYYRKFGYNINSKAYINEPSEETRLKMSLAKKGIHLNEEHKKKISETHKKRKWTEEHKQNVIKSCKNRKTKMSENLKQKLLKCHLGIKLTEEHKQKISKANKGKKKKPLTEEHKRKLSEIKKNKLYIISPETREKLSKAKKGFIVSEEVKQKISNGLKRYFANKKLNQTI